jgi:hypothetical protein
MAPDREARIHNTLAYLIRDIKHALLDFVINLLGCVDERLLDILSCLGRRLQKDQTILLNTTPNECKSARALGVSVWFRARRTFANCSPSS